MTDEEFVRGEVMFPDCPYHQISSPTCDDCRLRASLVEALGRALERSAMLPGALLRINELETALQTIEQTSRVSLDSRHKCEICGYSDGTVQYRGWHEDGKAMMTCKTCGGPTRPDINNAVFGI